MHVQSCCCGVFLDVLVAVASLNLKVMLHETIRNDYF